jgi:hypothetical protein
MAYIGTKPANQVIDSTLIADGTVTTADLANNAVTAAKLASTLDLTGKTVTLPAGTGGKLLQVVNTNITSNFNTTSSSYVHATNHSLSITTSSANSKIILFCNTPLQMSANTLEAQSAFRSSLDSYSANLGETIQANYSDGNGGWKQITNLHTVHSPSQAAGTTITYRIYLRRKAGSNDIYFPDPWGATYSFNFMAMEIAA